MAAPVGSVTDSVRVPVAPTTVVTGTAELSANAATGATSTPAAISPERARRDERMVTVGSSSGGGGQWSRLAPRQGASAQGRDARGSDDGDGDAPGGECLKGGAGEGERAVR